MDDVSHVEVSTNGMHEMVSPFRVAVTVATDDQHGQFVIGDFRTCCHGQRPPMETVK
jgi:hypothetical protein